MYVNMGYGKSHICATLGVKLFKEGKIVVFFPDFGLLSAKPLHVMKAVLHLTFDTKDPELVVVPRLAPSPP